MVNPRFDRRTGQLARCSSSVFPPIDTSIGWLRTRTWTCVYFWVEIRDIIQDHPLAVITLFWLALLALDFANCSKLCLLRRLDFGDSGWKSTHRPDKECHPRGLHLSITTIATESMTK